MRSFVPQDDKAFYERMFQYSVPKRDSLSLRPKLQKMLRIGLIRERKSLQDDRVAFTPKQCAYINAHYPNVHIVVEPSPIRCFTDAAYLTEGITITDDLNDCNILLGIKEVPVAYLIPDKTYFFFSHTKKKQPHNKKLMQALAEVGGAAPQGDLARVTITHKSGERQVLNLSHPETLGGTDKDIALAVGDVIYIPERRTQFTVVGEVSRPGSFDYRDEMTVMDALTTVGGVRETADLAGSTLIRDEKSERLDLDALLRRGDGSVNKKLEAGDRIVVPEIRNRVYFFGAVARPGYYNFKPTDTIIDALTGVGGPTSNASLRDVKHLRIDKIKNKSVISTINVEQFLKKGDLKGNIALQPGDILFVGDKKRPLQAQDMFGLFSGLGSIETVMRLFTGGR